jgi:hypothetical protein
MPKYRVELSDGRKFEVEADSPPSEQDILGALDSKPAPAAAAPQEKSVGDFLGDKLPRSAGRFVRDTVTGIPSLLKLIAQGASIMSNPGAHTAQLDTAGRAIPRVAGAVKDAAVSRYGSPSAIGNTLYNDPVGAAADVSTVTGLGALAAGGRAPRVASTLAKASNATNPMTPVGAVAKRGAREAGSAVVRGTLRPPKAVRDDFGGGRGVANAVLDERVYSDASAGRKLAKSTAKADQMIADAEAAGVPGVPAKDMADALSGRPAQTANRRMDLGVDVSAPPSDRRARILDRFTSRGQSGTAPTRVTSADLPDGVDAAIRASKELGPQARQIPAAVFGGDNPAAVRAAQQLGPQADLVPRRLLGESRTPGRTLEFGGTPPVPPTVRDIPLTRAQTLKREAQDLAYEASKNNLSLDQQSNSAIARALREGIEKRVPGVGPVNEQSQRLLGAKRAFAEAEDRPQALTNMLALGAGGTVGAGSGDLASALLTAVAMKAINSPRAGALAGIGLDSIGQGLNAASLRKAALLARMAAEE